MSPRTRQANKQTNEKILNFKIIIMMMMTKLMVMVISSWWRFWWLGGGLWGNEAISTQYHLANCYPKCQHKQWTWKEGNSFTQFKLTQKEATQPYRHHKFHYFLAHYEFLKIFTKGQQQYGLNTKITHNHIHTQYTDR